MPEAPEQKLIEIYCNGCRRNTKHEMLYRGKRGGTEEIEGGHIWWEDVYEVLGCRGCEEVTLRHSHEFSEHDGATVVYYPPRIARFLPNWRRSVPEELRLLMIETYAALQAGSARLALIGARTLIERTMVLSVGDAGSFAKNLNAFQHQGYLSSRNREFLEAALEAGHAAAHRAHTAGNDVINTTMDIVENLIHSVFVLGKEAEKMRKSIPARAAEPPDHST